MRINKRYISLLIILLPALLAPALAQDDAGICATLLNIQKILTGISVVVVTLAIMWAGYKFLFTRADITECGKILAAGVMIGSASTIAGWFMGSEECKDDVASRCVAPTNQMIALSVIYSEPVKGLN